MNVIRLLHTLLVLFVIFGVFSNDPRVLVIHTTVLISIVLHWLTNNDTCFLTTIEEVVYGKTEHKTFLKSLVSGIYNIPDEPMNNLVKGVTFFILLVSYYKTIKVFHINSFY